MAAPGPNCEFQYSGPSGPREDVGKPYDEDCEKTIRCVNRENLLDIITVKCPGKKKCQDWKEPQEETWYCPPNSNLACAGGGGYKKVPLPDLEGTSCGTCEADDCGCPDGYGRN